MRLDPKFQLVCDCKHKFAYRKKDARPKCEIVDEKLVLQKTIEEIINPLSLYPELANWFKETIHEVEDRIIQEKVELGKSRLKIKEEVERDLVKLESSVPTAETEKRDWKESMLEMVDLGLECRKMFEQSDIKAKKAVLYKSQSNLIWNEKNLYIIRPSWLDKYVNAVNYAKTEMATVEPNFISENPNKNKDISVLKSINTSMRIALSGC